MQDVKQENMDTTDDAGNSTEPADQILQDLRALQSPNGANSNSDPQQPQSEWDILFASLRTAPVDPEGWNRLVRLAEDSGDITRIKEAYDGLLQVYPNTVAAQIAYVNHFINPGQYQFAEELFKRFLLSSPHVDLWRVYLSYVRRINTSPQARENVRKAFDFALNHIGHDKEAGDIWVDYIRFIQQGETPTTRDEQTKMDQLRKVYQRAIQIPLENVEQLWQEYERFENGLNHVLAKKFMAEFSPAYMQARSVLRQLQKHVGAIFPKNPSPSLPIWLPHRPKFDASDRALVGAWKGYLRWEESNPLALEDKDKAVLVSRIRGVYRKALVRMRFFSEIWYMAYVWTATASTQAQALKLLKDGITANPTSFVLNFAYAEALELEGAGSFPAVHELYTTFLATLRAELEQREQALTTASAELSGSQDTSSMPDASQASLQMPNGFNAHAADEKNPARKDFNERRREYGVVWTMYMRFARRAEGTKAGRDVFAKARVDKLAPWQVYEAAAQTEYHSGRDANIATRIFQKGLEIFRGEAEYVVRYLSFLLSINDEKNAGALFSEVSKTFPPDQARPIWERWARHQYQYGDLATALAIEKNMAEVYPKDYPIKRFAQRHIYDGTDAIAARDLGFAYARQQTQTQNQNHSQSQSQSQGHSQNRELARQDTGQSLKRVASPERDSGYKRRERDEPGYKRGRGASPAGREPRRRYDSPHGGAGPAGPGAGWNDRDGGPGPNRGNKWGAPPPAPQQSAEERVQVPNVLSWFVGALPPASSFDGPVFRTDDLMQVFRNAVIPSATGPPRIRSPPPPPRGQSGGGRPPPDYGPYQGPGGGRRGGRY